MAVTSWIGDGLWLADDHSTVRVSSVRTSRDVLIATFDGEKWSGRGKINGSHDIDISFDDGQFESASISANGDKLLFKNGITWTRSNAKQSGCGWLMVSTDSESEGEGNDNSETISRNTFAMTATSQSEDSKTTGDISHAEQSEGKDADTLAAAASELRALRHEVALLWFLLDRFVLFMILLSTLLVMWQVCRVLPTWLVGIVYASSVGFVLATSSVAYAGLLDTSSAMIFILNAAVLVPFNFTMISLYYPTLPLRTLFYHLLQKYLIFAMSLGKVRVSFWQATYLEFLKVIPEAYNLLLPKDPALHPFDTIDDATKEQARTALEHAPFIIFLQRFSKKHLPRGLLNSLGFRLAFNMIMVPTLGWWMVGMCWVPLLSMPVKKTLSKFHATSQSSSVILKMPKCKFLSDAHKAFGEQLGRQKCRNECQQMMETIYSSGLGAPKMTVTPNFSTGCCVAELAAVDW